MQDRGQAVDEVLDEPFTGAYFLHCFGRLREVLTRPAVDLVEIENVVIAKDTDFFLFAPHR